MQKLLIAITLLIMLPVGVFGQARDTELPPSSHLSIPGKPQTDVVHLSSAWSADSGHPGDHVILAIVLDIKKGFHVIANAGQLTPMADFRPFPTSVTVESASPGLTIESARYPKAYAAEVDFIDGALMSFKGKTIVYLPMRVDANTSPGQMHVKVSIAYQACDSQVCLFPTTETRDTFLKIVKEDTIPSIINADLFNNYHAMFPGADDTSVGFDLFGWQFTLNTSSVTGYFMLLLTAAIGGALLNFTPCVLPLVPIKIISLSNAAANQKQCLALGLAMFSGVLAFWLSIGAAIALGAGFTATNQLFQYPVFTILVGAIIAIMAFGMCGLFSVRLPNFIYGFNPGQDTMHGSFGLGILTAILSTPCTAPFMGAAAAWAATRHPATTLITFAAIGVGMALPYLILSASPRLVQKMPRTGPASVLIKEVMGLFMLAAAAYFVGTGLSGIFSNPPNPPGKLYWWAVMGFTAAGGAWLAYRTFRITNRKIMQSIFAGLGTLVFIGSVYGGLHLADQGPIEWVYYTPERYESATDSGNVIVMNYTAEWCLNCKALEAGVLHNEKVIRLLAEADIIPMKVDITGNNPAAKARLKHIGHLTIPLLVVHSPGGEEVFRSDFYTVEQVMQAV